MKATQRTLLVPTSRRGSRRNTKILDQDHTAVEGPLYGVNSRSDGVDVLIIERIAAAITIHEAGYACLSPVTTTPLNTTVSDSWNSSTTAIIGRVVVVQDANFPTSDISADAEGWGALSIEQFGEGLKGAARTAGYLAEHGVDTQIGELPQPGAKKVDLDDYLQGWADTLAPIIASAVPAEQHPTYDIREEAVKRARREVEAAESTTVRQSRKQSEAAEMRSENGNSVLFDLTPLTLSTLVRSAFRPSERRR